jgi:tetratricopeptide (TPR) repeat protein
MAFALNDLATAYTWADDIGRAASVCEQAITLWRELGNLPMLTDGLLNAAGNAGYNEAYVRTLDLADEAFQIAASIGNVWSQSSSLSYQALAYVELGQAGQALAAYRASTELSQQAGFVQSQTRAQAHWGRLCGELGDVGRGLALVQQACQEGSGYTSGLLGMMICRLSLLTQAGDLDAAAALLAEMYHNFSRETLRTMLDMSPVEAEFLLAKGDFGEVMGLVDEMLAYFDRVHISKYRTYLLYLKAQALRKLDRLDEAWVILSHAHAEGEAKSLRWYLWRTLAALGEMEAQRGNSMEAQTLRRQAREIIDYIADDLARFAPAAEQDLRAAFLNKPDVRAILEQANE